MAYSPYAGRRLAVFQVRPLLHRDPFDGAQAVLLDLLRHFSTIGVPTTVYCGRHDGLAPRIELYPGVEVRPALAFHPDGTDPYGSTPYDLADIIDILRRITDTHDALYIHDSHLRFPFVGAQLPMISAIFELVYGHTVAGALSFERDRLVATSDYLASCLRATFDRFRPLPDDALHVINTGFGPEFRERPAGRLKERLNLPADAIAILHPHRPESAKGIVDALTALSSLKSRLRGSDYRRVKLLFPVVSSAGAEVPEDVRRYAAELGVVAMLHPHAWLPRRDMPQYYALGTATLCIGTFPEGFGNVHVESLLSGTPTIISRVAAHRTTVPEDLVHKVDPGDAEGAADALAEIIRGGERVSTGLRTYLTDRYCAQRMLRSYEHALLGCERRSPVPFIPPAGPVTATTRFTIPPWAAPLASGYYHDYSGYCTDGRFLSCLPLVRSGAAAGDLSSAAGVTNDDLERWLRAGLLVRDVGT